MVADLNLSVKRIFLKSQAMPMLNASGAGEFKRDGPYAKSMQKAEGYKPGPVP